MQKLSLHSSLPPIRDKQVAISFETFSLKGRLTVPQNAHGLVIFAHGSGSGRYSSRNWYVAEVLHEGNIATLLIDLLTEEEEQLDLRTRHLRFDIPLLSERLMQIAHWVRSEPITSSLKLGYFGSSTGGGAALIAAAKSGSSIAAVVSRGGRPDLAGPYLDQVKAPTLLIVGEKDLTVLDLNRDALKKLNKQSRLHIIPGATHLFEEPGTLRMAAQEATKWFKRYLD